MSLLFLSNSKYQSNIWLTHFRIVIKQKAKRIEIDHELILADSLHSFL